MSAQLPVTYYEDQANHGNYIYVSLEEMVDNFMQIYTGNSTLLGPIQRHTVLFWMKKGIQGFTADALQEVKAVELELGDALDIVMPPDYLAYVRISWLNEHTGHLMRMSQNTNIPIATAYLQDHEAFILFDSDGYVLEGDSATNAVNDGKKDLVPKTDPDCNLFYDNYSSQLFRIDTGKNYNGTFIENKRLGKIHFDSGVGSKIIVLEYVSDGLEYSSESDIKINKYAEYALYNWTNWNLLNNKMGTPLYEKNRAKRDYDTSFRNAKIKLMNLRVAEISQIIKGRNRWIH
jgi:hypothetical protein